jgi:hypothetical protein
MKSEIKAVLMAPCNVVSKRVFRAFASRGMLGRRFIGAKFSRTALRFAGRFTVWSSRFTVRRTLAGEVQSSRFTVRRTLLQP